VTHILRNSRRGQRGTVMILVITIIAALLAAAGVALYLQISSTKAAGLSGHTRSALYCAEAGLAAARPLISAPDTSWSDLLDTDTANDPAWYPIEGDIDDDVTSGTDYIVTVRDNDDEYPRDLNTDADNMIIIVSRCTKYPNTPREVLEIVSRVVTEGHHYTDQGGGDESNSGFVGGAI
jgi:hypothetical protein